MMDFYEVLAEVVQLLQREGRATYRALKRQFNLDDAYIEDLKEELLFSHPVVDENSRGLVWTGETQRLPQPTSQPNQPEPHPVVEQAQPIPATSLPIEPHTPDAERRQLTVMFCDLVGSTELSGKLDPEDYREVVRAYQTTCSEVIQRFDCHIAQTLGDGLLIYSGYPVAHENDAERAVRVGLGILDAMKALNEGLEQDKGIRLAVRVGIHTGPVVVGEVGAGTKQEQLALGETPNVAARVQGLAEPDTLVISAETYRLTQGFFECESLGEHDLRGVAQPIAVYQVLQESGAQNRLDVATTRGLTPLIGRQQETELLLQRWNQVKDGQGQVILLSGEAGIGKSRLVQVLKDHVAEEPHTRLECRSSQYFTNSALYPITDFLQRTLRFQVDDTPETRLEKLVQNLGHYRLPLEESIPLFASFLSLPIREDCYPSLNLSPQRQRQKTLEAIVAIILELSEQQPVLFILEDLHWTDPTTLEFIDLLTDQTPTASICILLTCRPEFQPSWSHRSYLTEITVNGLSQPQIVRMAEQVAGGKGLPTEIVQQLVDKTDGVPLYVEEMTKAVLESGVLKETNGHYELAGSIASLSIPATLQDSLMARLDRLVTAKAVAQYASVIGRQFSYELLQAVSQLDEATLQRELGRLVEAELVYQRGLPPQSAYQFKHALVTDIAYQSLLRSTRQQYHQRIAKILEEQLPETAETQPELLAHHFTEAGLNETSVGYWQQAGQRAIMRSAYAEAIAHLTQGLTVLTPLPETPERLQQELDLQVALGPALIATKGNAAPEVERVYARAQELCQRMGDTSQLFPVLRGLMLYYINRGGVQMAHQLGEQLLRLAQFQNDPAFLMLAHYMLGMVFNSRGEPASAQTHLTQALDFYIPQEHRNLAWLYGSDLSVASHTQLVWGLWFLGHPDQAMQHSQEALRLAQEVSHPQSLVLALFYGASLHQYRREVQATHEQAESVMTMATEEVFALRLAQGIVLHGWVLAMQGQNESGIATIRQGLASTLATGDNAYTPYFLGLLADAYREGGHSEEGLNVMDEVAAVMETTELRWYEAELHRLKGELLLQQSSDNATEAESCFHQAITIAQNQSAKSWELRAATSLARLWQSQGKREEARALLAPIYDWFTEGFDTADLIDAKTLLDALS